MKRLLCMLLAMMMLFTACAEEPAAPAPEPEEKQAEAVSEEKEEAEETEEEEPEEEEAEPSEEEEEEPSEEEGEEEAEPSEAEEKPSEAEAEPSEEEKEPEAEEVESEEVEPEEAPSEEEPFPGDTAEALIEEELPELFLETTPLVIDGFTAEISPEGTLTITACEGSGDITLPAALDSMTVSAIGSEAFAGHTGTLTVPSGLSYGVTLSGSSFCGMTVTALNVEGSAEVSGSAAIDAVTVSGGTLTVSGTLTPGTLANTGAVLIACGGALNCASPEGTVISLHHYADGVCPYCEAVLTITPASDTFTKVFDDADYEFSADDFTLSDDSVTIEGISQTNGGSDAGSYTETLAFTLNGDNTVPDIDAGVVIDPKPLTDDDIAFEDIKAQSRTGSEIKPALTITYETEFATYTLAEGLDYTAEYADNIEAGTAKVTVTGTGNFTGTVEKTFKIKASVTVTPESAGKTYGDADPALNFTVSGGVRLEGSLKRASGEDAGDYSYDISDLKRSNPDYDITLGGGKFTIKPRDISEADSEKIPDQSSQNASSLDIDPTLTFNGETLTRGTDYTARTTYDRNKDTATNTYKGTVTVTGKGNFTGSKIIAFTIKSETSSSGSTGSNTSSGTGGSSSLTAAEAAEKEAGAEAVDSLIIDGEDLGYIVFDMSDDQPRNFKQIEAETVLRIVAEPEAEPLPDGGTDYGMRWLYMDTTIAERLTEKGYETIEFKSADFIARIPLTDFTGTVTVEDPTFDPETEEEPQMIEEALDHYAIRLYPEETDPGTLTAAVATGTCRFAFVGVYGEDEEAEIVEEYFGEPITDPALVTRRLIFLNPDAADDYRLYEAEYDMVMDNLVYTDIEGEYAVMMPIAGLYALNPVETEETAVEEVEETETV